MLGSGPLGATAFGHAGDDDGAAVLLAVTAHLTIGAHDAALVAARLLDAETGSLTITAYDVEFVWPRVLVAETAHLTITPYAVGPNIMGADTAHLTITGRDLTFARGLFLPADTAHLAIGAYDVVFAVPRFLQAETAHLVISGGFVVFDVGSQKFNLIEALRIAEAQFQLTYAQDLSVLASGGTRGEDIGPPRWRARLTTIIEGHDDMAAIDAEINILNGVRGTVYIWNPKKPGPRHDRDGAILGENVVLISAVDGERISLKGLPAGYHLSKGDFIHFDIGSPSVRVLHQIYDDAIADGAGNTDLFRVTPAPFVGTVADLAVTLIRPAAEMVIVPGSVQPRQVSTLYDQLSFEAEQVLA